MTTLKRERMDVFSTKLVRRQRLPHGTEFRLIKKSDGIAKRRNTNINRRLITDDSCPRLPDDKNVTNLRDMVAKKVLTTDVEQRGWEVQVFGPNRKKVHGRTSMGALRRMTPKLTQDELEQKGFDRELEVEVQDEMEKYLREASRYVDDPAGSVARATMRAMVSRFGTNATRDAAEHILRKRMR